MTSGSDEHVTSQGPQLPCYLQFFFWLQLYTDTCTDITRLGVSYETFHICLMKHESLMFHETVHVHDLNSEKSWDCLIKHDVANFALCAVFRLIFESDFADFELLSPKLVRKFVLLVIISTFSTTMFRGIKNILKILCYLSIFPSKCSVSAIPWIWNVSWDSFMKHETVSWDVSCSWSEHSEYETSSLHKCSNVVEKKW